MSGSQDTHQSHIDRNPTRLTIMNSGLLAQLYNRAGPFTWAVVVVCVVIFLITGFGSNQELLQHFWFEPDLIMQGQIWRLITPCFVHFMIGGLPLHILFNMMWWVDLGGAIERYYSWQYLAAISAAIGIASNFAQYYVTGSYFFGGMSGVVYGLLGFIYLRGRFDRRFTIRIHPSIMNFMLIWLVLGFVVFSSVANFAHLGGLVSGALLAVLLPAKR